VEDSAVAADEYLEIVYQTRFSQQHCTGRRQVASQIAKEIVLVVHCSQEVFEVTHKDASFWPFAAHENARWLWAFSNLLHEKGSVG
jgi:hypothetical protein